MKKHLMICNTAWQLMIAINIRCTLLSEENVDFLITDHMNDCEKLVQKVNESMENSKAYGVYCAKKLTRRKKKIDYFINKEIISSYLDNIVDIEWNYSDLYFVNLDLFAEIVFVKVRKSCRDCHLYEEGLATYTDDFSEQIIHAVRGKKYAGFIRDIWLFKKDLISDRLSEFSFVDIPGFSKCDQSLLNKMNKIFSYNEKQDNYDKKIIFMEESYFADGKEINDIGIVEALAEKFGKENIMIKIHPRNPENRFEKLGYKTNRNMSVPWELITLNENIEDKILCTMMSNAALSPWWLGINTHSMMFYECVDQSLLNSNFLPLVRKICASQPDVFLIPKSLEEFAEMEISWS